MTKSLGQREQTNVRLFSVRGEVTLMDGNGVANSINTGVIYRHCIVEKIILLVAFLLVVWMGVASATGTKGTTLFGGNSGHQVWLELQVIQLYNAPYQEIFQETSSETRWR